MDLKLFGGLRLETPHAAQLGRAGQPRRLALLATLALARGRTLRREEIIVLLWPGRSEDAARRLLSSAIYDLRAVLGEAALTSTGDSIALSPDTLDIDTVRFEAAVRAKRWSDAIALHAGELLAGVDLEGSAELEQLIDERREGFLAAFAHALECEAERLAALGETAPAIELWTRLVETRPYEPNAVLHLMKAFDSQGDRTAALEQARLHTERMRRDLEAEPDTAVTALATELRNKPTPAFVPPPAAAVLPAPATPSATAVRSPRRRRWQWLGVAAAAALLLSVKIAGEGNATNRVDESGPVRFAVFPFVTVGDSEYRYLGDAMARLLSTDLDGGGRLVALSPAAVIRRAGAVPSTADVEQLRRIAGELGARRFVTGTAIANGQRLRLTSVMHTMNSDAASRSTAGEGLIEVTVEGPAADLPALVDSLSVRLMVGEARSTDRLVRVAAATTASMPALKSYLRGERLFQDGDYAAAAMEFNRATVIDQAFAMAHYRCSLATLWADLPGTSTAEHDAQAQRYSERLAARDRELVLAYSAWRHGDAADAERRYRALYTRYSDDVEAGFQLAETIFHYGPLIGHPIAEARGIFAEVLRVEPRHRGARWHLAMLDGAAGNRDALVKDLAALGPASPSDVDERGFRHRLEGQPFAGDSLLRNAAPGQLWALAWRLGIHLHDLDGAHEAFQMILRMDRSVQSLALRGEELLELAHGRWRGGATLGEEPAALTLDGLAVNGVLSLPPAEVSLLIESVREALSHTDSVASESRARRVRLATALGRLSLVRHDSAGAIAARVVLVRSGDSAAVHSLDAFLAAKAAHWDEVIRQLDLAHHTVFFGAAILSPDLGEQPERFLRAEALLAQGRLEEALRWYSGLGEFALDDLPYVARAEQRRSEILERLARHADALSSLRRVNQLWSTADPRLVPGVGEARAALARRAAR